MKKSICVIPEIRERDSEWLVDGGEMGELIRRFDWSKTPLGPRDSWPLALRMMTNFLLANRFPLLLWWGPEFHQIYNDAYRPVLGTKHPDSALGKPVSQCWHEIWHVLAPLIKTPFNGGPATWMEDIALEINRHGFVEETHFTIAYSPVPDETTLTGIGGVLATVHEISAKVVAERRVGILRDLGARATEGKTAGQACKIAAQVLANHPKDVPFALLYLPDQNRKQALLAAACGVEAGREISPVQISLENLKEEGWSLSQTFKSDAFQVVPDLGDKFREIPPGPWSNPPQYAAVVPIRSNIAHQSLGVMVVGLSARLPFDEQYRSFLEIMATQISTAIANACAYEEERKRAEALAAIDRAKTTFFSNVSHEFRTPLTLLLGPTEELLHQVIDPRQKEILKVIQRNGLRLQKLVNTLLDFSRIEAGRADICYEPTALASYTMELASAFRSAIEQAGLRFTVDCAALSQLAYVDRDMWEKIVLNLVSNAFKFTLAGTIHLKLEEKDGCICFAVEDTGTGIPAEDLPKIFERFHRVQGARGRTYEGSGIGLALVHELVRLHGGTITVKSVLAQGTVFTVSLPLGYEHLPVDRVRGKRHLAPTGIGAKPYVEEALRWLPHAAPHTPEIIHVPHRPKILLADDNSDMRDYMVRLLSPYYEVETCLNGREALKTIQSKSFDLLLSDVMMPDMDGFELVKAVRSTPQASTLPVILVSAQASEEARIEGIQIGADDYMIKPFSAKELLVRVHARLEIARARKEALTIS